jgi:hypothetical protein
MLNIRFGSTKDSGGRTATLLLLLGVAQVGLLSLPAVALDRGTTDTDSVSASAATSASALDPASASSAIVLAQADDSEDSMESRPLEPRYEPREPQKKSWYNSSYLFGMTRGVADSTIAPAGKVPLFFLTVPLDIVFLPFAAIGGLFG